MYGLLAIIAGLSSLIFVSRDNKNRLSIYILIYDLLWVIMFFTIAFRGENIGSDTINYINKYFSILDTSSYFSFGGIGSTEPLYFYLNRFLGSIFGEWSQCIFIAEALFVTLSYGVVFLKNSINPIISVLAFLTFGLYLTSLCLLRQFIAMSICVWSLKYVFERKPIYFVICTLLATTFHYTAIFWFVVYFICVIMARSRRTDWFYIIIAIIGYFYVDVFQEAASYANDRWSSYNNIEEGAAGYFSFSMYFLITIMAFVYRKSIKNKYRYGNELFNLNYVHMIFWTMRLVTRNAERLTFYFTIAPILLVPIIFDVVEKKYGEGTGILFKCIAVALMTFMFIYKYSKDKSLYPYEFISFNF